MSAKEDGAAKTRGPIIRWSAEEDASLMRLVEEHGSSAWTMIASKLVGGGRNDNQCRGRWTIIDPSISKEKWSAEEDESLRVLFEEHGKGKWTVIASKLVGGGRNNKQCSSHWITIDPSKSKEKWSAEEDESLMSLVQEYGLPAWTMIAS